MPKRIDYPMTSQTRYQSEERGHLSRTRGFQEKLQHECQVTLWAEFYSTLLSHHGLPSQLIPRYVKPSCLRDYQYPLSLSPCASQHRDWIQLYANPLSIILCRFPRVLAWDPLYFIHRDFVPVTPGTFAHQRIYFHWCFVNITASTSDILVLILTFFSLLWTSS